MTDGLKLFVAVSACFFLFMLMIMAAGILGNKAEQDRMETCLKSGGSWVIDEESSRHECLTDR